MSNRRFMDDLSDADAGGLTLPNIFGAGGHNRTHTQQTINTIPSDNELVDLLKGKSAAGRRQMLKEI